MTSIRILYVDDFVSASRDVYRDEVERYARRLASDGRIECNLVPSVSWENVNELLGSTVYDLYLVDYQLSLQQTDGHAASYKGSTLAEEIRDRYPDKPIILITRESILEGLDYQRRRQLLHKDSVFDELILKSQLDDEIQTIQDEIVSMVAGFTALREQTSKDWKGLFAILGADEDEEGKLREAAPPVQDGEWIVTEASRWIRHVVMEYPGILYDSLYAATLLGISQEAFLSPEIQQIFEHAEYRGSFSVNAKRRWWRGRLLTAAQDYMLSNGVKGNVNSAFARAFAKTTSIELPLAICTWDKQPIADWVCCIRHEPVKLKHTIRYYPDNRPSNMDEPRVSYRAVRENKEFQEALLDSRGLEMVSGIEAMDDPAQ